MRSISFLPFSFGWAKLGAPLCNKSKGQVGMDHGYVFRLPLYSKEAYSMRALDASGLYPISFVS